MRPPFLRRRFVDRSSVTSLCRAAFSCRPSVLADRCQIEANSYFAPCSQENGALSLSAEILPGTLKWLDAVPPINDGSHMLTSSFTRAGNGLLATRWMKPCNRWYLICVPRSKISLARRSTSSWLGAGPHVCPSDRISGSPGRTHRPLSERVRFSYGTMSSRRPATLPIVRNLRGQAVCR